jgi:hypothetical protein
MKYWRALIPTGVRTEFHAKNKENARKPTKSLHTTYIQPQSEFPPPVLDVALGKTALPVGDQADPGREDHEWQTPASVSYNAATPVNLSFSHNTITKN